MNADLAAGAEAVLRRNDLGDYTRPSPRLYPHQWNWDSAFITLGWAAIDWERAVREIDALLAAQWTNGMLPHIRYNHDVTDYSPGPEWWTDPPVRQPGVLTSGISQPPVLPTAVYLIGLQQPNVRRRLEWWTRLYEPLSDALRFYVEQRTVADSPLIVVVHPWESGLDNSPRWDFAVDAGYRPTRPYRRTDITRVATGERPTQHDYDLYMYLVELIAQHRYTLPSYLPSTPFAVYDALFNAVWYRAALDLNRIAVVLDRPPVFGESVLLRFRGAYTSTLLNDEKHIFRDFDLKKRRKISIDTIAGLAAIYGGLVDADQAAGMVERYRARSPGCRLFPSVLPDQREFEPDRYWRGPVWVNLNWMLARGLEALGVGGLAADVAAGTLEMVRTGGWREYFHPHTAQGLGGDEFSWTAALVLDLIRRPVT